MKIFAFSLIKNEEDVIEQNLIEASKWAHKIFVYDNGSTDSTWNIVKKIANDRIIPYKSEAKPYRDSLRNEIFNYFKAEFSDGDWLCFKLDADEFYIDDPRDFLIQLSRNVKVVYGLNIEYQFTNENENDKFFNSKNFRYAKIQHCEQRFFKYRDGLVWKDLDSLPTHPGPPSRRMIKFAHYQFRTVEQIKKRLSTRKLAIESGYKAYWDAEINSDWKAKIVNKDECSYLPLGDDLTYRADKINRVSIPESWLTIVIKNVIHGLGFWR